jgi:hypothetical protein
LLRVPARESEKCSSLRVPPIGLYLRGSSIGTTLRPIHSLDPPIVADYNEATPNQPGGTLTYQQRAPIPTFGPITWVDPAGNNHYNGLSARVEHRFAGGLYFLNSFTWGKAIGDSEQALEYYAGYFQANPQNIHDLAAEAGPSSFDVKLNNVSSIVYDLPFGKGRKYGSAMHPAVDGVLGGWELNTINTAHTGTPLNVFYTPSTANSVSGLSNDYRGEPFLRPDVSGSAVSQSTSSSINNYFNGYTFSTPPVNDPFGDLGRNAFRAPGLEQWDLSANKSFRIVEKARIQVRSEFFNVMNHTNFGIPNTTTTSSSFGQIPHHLCGAADPVRAEDNFLNLYLNRDRRRASALSCRRISNLGRRPTTCSAGPLCRPWGHAKSVFGWTVRSEFYGRRAVVLRGAESLDDPSAR